MLRNILEFWNKHAEKFKINFYIFNKLNTWYDTIEVPIVGKKYAVC